MTDETNHDGSTSEDGDAGGRVGETFASTHPSSRLMRMVTALPHRRRWLVGVAALVLVAIFALVFWPGGKASKNGSDESRTDNESGSNEADEVALSLEALNTIGIETEDVTERAAVAQVKVTGAVEANAEREQMVVPLVSGRVGAVFVSLGQRVTRGTVLATIESQQIAELRGQLLEAESKLALATANVERVKQTANRAGVISAKAKLDLAEKTLDRQRRLLELGAGSLKEVQAAETEYQTAKAEYDFQSNIAIKRDVQQAENERETARAVVERLRQGLAALGANPDNSKANATVPVTSPSSGVVIKREVNAGAGIQEGNPLFTIADISTVWVIANVPEAQINSLRVGTPAQVRSAALSESVLAGHIAYIDPQLNEETRTARVRVEVPNFGEKLKVGMFVEVGFQTGTATGNELVVREEAIQRIGDRSVVFIPEEGEPGHFKVRDVEVGGQVDGYRRIVSGLTLGERVVTKGSFTLKSRLLKGQFGEDKD